MTSRLGNKPSSDAPVERYLAPRELKISTIRGYRVVYLCPKERRATKLYVDSVVRRLFESADEFVPLANEIWRPVVGYEGLYEVTITVLR